MVNFSKERNLHLMDLPKVFGEWIAPQETNNKKYIISP